MALLCIDNLLQMCALILFLFLFFWEGGGVLNMHGLILLILSECFAF